MNNKSIDKPLVSIVLPTYNRAYVLPHAIRSVLSQSYTHWELIIVDDNSPDDTQAVIQSFNDSRIRYVRNEPNLKLPRALNKGFSLAQGDLLTWTSDDNLFAANAIEKMVVFIQSEQCDCIYADYDLFSDLDANGVPLNTSRDYLPDQMQLEKGNHMGACFMYTRQVYHDIGDYDPELFLVEDYDYFIRISKRFKMCHLPESLYYFRRDDNTLYCSRFCEVKASDFLVRFKNGLIDENAVIEGMVTLLMCNIDGLKNAYLRGSYNLIHNRSFKLTQLHKMFTSWFLMQKISKQVKYLLNTYATEQATFKDTRDQMKNILQSNGTIEYSNLKAIKK
ncbi:MAG: glycosyltransferase [Methyloprofundus sp.]|nr:glycosyltransferase [Methyloprofundus sp.]